MRWYISYPILAAGLAFGFDTLFPDRPADLRSSPSFETASRETSSPDVMTAEALDAVEPSRLGAFSPGVVLATADLDYGAEPRTSVFDYLAQTFAPLDVTPVSAAPAPPPAATPVTVASWTSAVIAADGKPVAAPASRIALARDIQTELARVGCYLGEIDGVWGGGSKRAATIFMDRVNAALPTQEPDVFLLSLLRAEDDEVCGAACPQGQSLTATGRCVPSTLLAQSGKAHGTPDTHEEPPVITASISDDRPVPRPVPAVRPPVPYGRMSIGGPKPDERDGDALGASTAVSPGYERTAAIVDTDDSQSTFEPEAMPIVEPTSFDAAVEAAPIRKAKSQPGRSGKSARNGGKRYGTYRHVQRLFEHPLGRM